MNKPTITTDILNEPAPVIIARDMSDKCSKRLAAYVGQKLFLVLTRINADWGDLLQRPIH